MAIKNKAKYLTGINPLAYMGVEPTTPPQFITDRRAPTQRDIDNYNIGTIWLDTITQQPYMLTSLSGGVATWTLLSPGGTGANTFNTDQFGPAHDAAGVLSVIGFANQIFTDGATPNTVTIGIVDDPHIIGTATIDTGINSLGVYGNVVAGYEMVVVDAAGDFGSIPAGSLPYTREAGAAVAMDPSHGYVNTNVGLTTFTLPAVAALGTVIEILGESAGLWSIAQNAGQTISFGAVATTVGVGGSITATKANDSVVLRCRVTDTTWQVIGYCGGPFNVV